MRGARPTSLLLVALALAVAALAAACGAASGTPSAGDHASTLQTRLRALASGAPEGARAYWLGPRFGEAPISFVNPGWGRFAMLSYHTFDDAVDIDVETFAGRAISTPGGHRVVVQSATGQEIVLVFRSPEHPSARLVRAATAALQPIPLDVRYLS